jgi:hypothetical protein
LCLAIPRGNDDDAACVDVRPEAVGGVRRLARRKRPVTHLDGCESLGEVLHTRESRFDHHATGAIDEAPALVGFECGQPLREGPQVVELGRDHESSGRVDDTPARIVLNDRQTAIEVRGGDEPRGNREPATLGDEATRARPSEKPSACSNGPGITTTPRRFP